MTDREFIDITADVDALLADPSHARAIASARESLARADREWAIVCPQTSAPMLADTFDEDGAVMLFGGVIGAR